MEAALCENNADEQAVPRQGDDIGNEKWDASLHVLVLKAWTAQAVEDCVTNTSVV